MGHDSQRSNRHIYIATHLYSQREWKRILNWTVKMKYDLKEKGQGIFERDTRASRNFIDTFNSLKPFLTLQKQMLTLCIFISFYFSKSNI